MEFILAPNMKVWCFLASQGLDTNQPEAASQEIECDVKLSA